MSSVLFYLKESSLEFEIPPNWKNQFFPYIPSSFSLFVLFLILVYQTKLVNFQNIYTPTPFLTLFSYISHPFHFTLRNHLSNLKFHLEKINFFLIYLLLTHLLSHSSFSFQFIEQSIFKISMHQFLSSHLFSYISHPFHFILKNHLSNLKFHLEKINFFLISSSHSSSFSFFVLFFVSSLSNSQFSKYLCTNPFLTPLLLYFSSVSFYLKESSLEFLTSTSVEYSPGWT